MICKRTLLLFSLLKQMPRGKNKQINTETFNGPRKLLNMQVFSNYSSLFPMTMKKTVALYNSLFVTENFNVILKMAINYCSILRGTLNKEYTNAK